MWTLETSIGADTRKQDLLLPDTEPRGRAGAGGGAGAVQQRVQVRECSHDKARLRDLPRAGVKRGLGVGDGEER